jgi:hypothetical protein
VLFEEGSELKEIKGEAFLGSSVRKLEIPPKCEALNVNSLYRLNSLTVSKENPFFLVEDSFLKSSDRKRLMWYMGSEEKVVVKKEVEVIGEGCVWTRYGEDLREVIFETESRLRRIEKGAFALTRLKAIIIPSSVEKIGTECFSKSGSLSEVTFEPKSRLKEIQSSAFSSTGLKKMIIPPSVEVIGDSCFSACASLREISFEKDSELTEIGDRAFHGTKIERFEIPSKCQILNGLSLFDVNSVTVSKENPFFVIEEAFIKSSDKKRLIWYMGSESRIVVEKEVEVIGEGCFYQHCYVREVVFEKDSKVRRLERKAFYWTGLREVVIPASVEFIGEYCFVQDDFLNVRFEGQVAVISQNAIAWSWRPE